MRDVWGEGALLGLLFILILFFRLLCLVPLVLAHLVQSLIRGSRLLIVLGSRIGGLPRDLGCESALSQFALFLSPLGLVLP